MRDHNTDGSRTSGRKPSPGSIIDNSPIGLYIVQDGKFQMVNLQFQKEIGYTEPELIGQESLKLVHPEDTASVRASAILMLKGLRASPYEYRVVRKDGEVIHILETVASIEYRGKRAVFGNFMNITERKLAEEKARCLAQTLRLLGQVGQLILETDDEKELLRKACALIIAGQNYKLIWIGFLQGGASEIVPAARAGFDEQIPPAFESRRRNAEYGSGPAGMAVKMERPFVIRDAASDHWYQPWRDEAVLMGYRSAAALPLKIGGETIGALTVCSAYADAFDDEEIGLLAELAGNISLGIQKIRQGEQYKRAEQALRESEEKYRELVERANDGIVLVQDSEMKLVNQKMAEMLGYTIGELTDKHFTVLLRPEDVPRFAAIYNQRMAGESVESNYEAVLRHKSGRDVNVEVNAGLITYKGKHADLAIVRDITERKQTSEALRQSEEMLRLMFESLADGVVVCDTSGKITQANQVKARMHGYDSKEEIIGKSLLDLIAEKDRDKFRANMALVFKGTALQHVEYTFLHKDGREFPGEASAALIRDAAGQPLGFIGVSRDVTESKKLEERLMVTDRLAFVGELASGIAHELGNPLTSIVGFAELLLNRQDLPRDARADLETIYKEAQRTTTIVRNLLAFARKQTTGKAPLAVNAAIKNVLSLRAYQHQVSNIQVVTNLAENLPPVIADSFQFQQALINIIINAEYFMVEAHGKGTLTVTTVQDEDAVKISVTDDGPGIARKDLGRIFDPFFTTKEVGKGTGLGLSICHGIVTEHGGQLFCESEPDQGATFIMRLPVRRSLGTKEGGSAS